MLITVQGANGDTTQNATDGAVFYRIASLTAGVLTLAPGTTLLTETNKSVGVAPILVDPSFAATAVATTATVRFAATTAAPGAITRTDGGSFVVDGYAAGQLLHVAGSADNSTSGGIVYTISAVTASTITLSSGDRIEATAGTEAVTLTRGVAPVVAAIQIAQVAPINVVATGDITINAGGDVGLNSTADILVNQINSFDGTLGNAIRVKGKASILNAAEPGNGGYNLAGAGIILEAAQGGVGQHDALGVAPLLIDTLATTTVTARAMNTIAIGGVTTVGFATGAGDLAIDTIYSATGDVYLTALGSITDALNTDFTKIQARHIDLTAGGQIGGDGNYLDLLAGTTVTAVAGSNIWLSQTAGNLGVDHILSQTGDVTLRAALSILDEASATYDGSGLASLPNPDVFGRNITLTALSGGIGTAGNALDIISGYSGPGTLSASSGLGSIYVIQTSGDLSLGTVSTGAGQSAFITVPLGSIVNGAAQGTKNVLSGTTQLFARDAIGSDASHITSAVGALEAQSTTGSTWIDNIGGLTLGIAGSANAGAIVTGGAATITASSPVTIAKSITATTGISIDALDAPGDDLPGAAAGVPDNLVVNARDAAGKAIVLRSTGVIALTAADDVSIAAGVSIQSGTGIAITGGDQNADDAATAAGSHITVAGTLSAPGIQIQGGVGADTITVTGTLLAGYPWTPASFPAAFGMPFPLSVPTQSVIVIEGNAGDDRIVISGAVVSRETAVFGGAGNDTITVAPTNMAAAGLASSGDVAIVGGPGLDQVTVSNVDNLSVYGTDGDDAIAISRDHVVGAGLDLVYGGVRNLVVNGLGGNDHFFVLGTAAGVVTTLVGGGGSNVFDVGGDVTAPIPGLPASMSAAQPHRTSQIQGALFIEGDTLGAEQDDGTQTNTLNVFNDGSSTNDSGTLGAPNTAGGLSAIYGVAVTADTIGQFGNVTGLNAANKTTVNFGTAAAPDNRVIDGGITYRGVHVVDVMLGTGDDRFDVYATTAGSTTVIQGGGGSNRLAAHGNAGGPNAPLVLFGSTSQDGSFYSSTATNLNGHAREFTNVGNNVLDASQDTQSVILYGGAGNDSLYGGQSGSWLVGGGGADTIHGHGTGDIILGDDGVNLDLSTRFSLSSHVVSFASAPAAGDDAKTHDALKAGNDILWADGAGGAIVVGDHGLVTQVAGTNSLLTTGQVLAVQTARPEDGGNDQVHANGAGNVLLGGSGSDSIYALTGSSIVLGDNGRVTYSSPGVLLQVASTDPAYGGNDAILTKGGDAVVIGGAGADSINASGGFNILFGDDGEVDYASGGISAKTIDAAAGGNDGIVGGDGTNIVFGGAGNDSFNGGSGLDVVLGDDGMVTLDDQRRPALVQTTDPTVAGNDTIYLGSGGGFALGGGGNDSVHASGGNNVLLGDDGRIAWDIQGRLSAIVSTDPGVGGADRLGADGGGSNIVIGGAGNDAIRTAGAGILFGDDGELDFTAGRLVRAMTLDEAVAGSDSIAAGAGQNVIFGGGGSDVLTAAGGNNLVFGDGGVVTFDSGHYPTTAQATVGAHDGRDVITTGNGNDLVLTGGGNDSVNAGGGTNQVLRGNAFAYPGQIGIGPQPVWQSAAAAAPDAAAARAVTDAELARVVVEAKAIWTAALPAGDPRLALLGGVQVEVGTLPPGRLGVTLGDTIVIDATAAGWGWFTDVSANGRAAFGAGTVAGVLLAAPGSAASGHMDLLSTVLHEMGNAMGIAEDHGDDVAGMVLAAGERRMPAPLAPPVAPAVAPAGAIVIDWSKVSSPPPLPSAAAPAWVGDFVNHLGRSEQARSPNASIRVTLPA